MNLGELGTRLEAALNCDGLNISDARPRAGRILAIACASLALLGAGGAETQPSLPDLLRGLDRASYLYLDSALNFACKEKLVERGAGKQNRVNTFEYLFVYDKETGFQDYRTLPGKANSEQVNPSGHGVRAFLSRAYMWVLGRETPRHSGLPPNSPSTRVSSCGTESLCCADCSSLVCDNMYWT